VEGRLYAVGNRCPHRGGPLVRGRLEKLPESGAWAVRCPIHGWLFDLATGKAVAPAGASAVSSYEVTCASGEICLTAKEKAAST
jgi:nitrite reductase/ring-hydroxylating ferredoxin subunit